MFQPTEITPDRAVYSGHIPFVRFLLALSSGIIAGNLIAPTHVVYPALVTLCLASLVIFLAIACFGRLWGRRYAGIPGVFFLLFLAASGWVRVWQPDPAVDATHFSRARSTALLGYIADEPSVGDRHIRFPLAVTHCKGADTLKGCSGTLMLTIRREDRVERSPFAYGDRLVIPADYEAVEPPYNPGEMDYKRYLANQDTWHQAYLPVTDVHKLNSRGGHPLVARALELRARMVAKFARCLSDSVALSVASTLILGYRATLSPELIDSFSVTGTIHVLSVSGMHVVIVCWLLAKLLGRMGGGTYGRIARLVLLLTGIWGYALLTGFSPAVLRASMMISMIVLATGFGLSHQQYNSIAASAFFLLWYHPKWLADIGFQLSYLAVLGMVFLLPTLQRMFPVRHPYLRPVADYAGMSVAAQTGAGPLAAYYFHQFPLYFLPANLLIVLPVSAIMYLGFALLLLPYGEYLTWIGQLLEYLILLTYWLLDSMAQWPLARIAGIRMSWWENLLLYLGIILFVRACSGRSKRMLYGALGVTLLLGFSSSLSESGKVGRHEVVLFNTGRHMAIGFIGPDDAWLYSDLPAADHPTIRFRVMPELESVVAANHIHFIRQDRRYRDDRLYIRSGLIQFGDRRVLVYDNEKSYHGRLDVDILLLRNNPHVGLDELRQVFSFRQLVLDGSNYDRTIARFTAEAKSAGVPVYVLKRNFAYVWPTEAPLP